MMPRILMIVIVGMLTSCVSGVSKQDTYTDRNGDTTVIQTNREMCVQSCNDDYNRCMDSDAAQTNPAGMPPGMFGASGDCRSALKDCLPQCKGQ